MTDRIESPHHRVAGLLLAALLVLAACSSGSDGASTTEPGTATESTATEPGEVDTTATTEVIEDQGPARPDGPVPTPELSGPIEGGQYGVPYNPIPPALAEQYGYQEAEYFMAGTATAYLPTEALAPDGAWALEAGDTADYQTRIIVRRPADDADFNGTVLVEWLNVSAGRDSDPDFGFLHPEIMREGYGYVGVSAQSTGVEGGTAPVPVPGVPPEGLAALKQWDPERYEALSHPGDEYSYDMFSQAAEAVAQPGDLNPFEGVQVSHLIAMGESQSAGRMVSYVNGIQPISEQFDGFLVHSRGGGSAAYSVDTADLMPKTVAIRTDLDQPVLQFQTETDVIRLGFLPARQPDTDKITTWEVAGTAHADQATLDYGVASGQVWGTNISFDANALCGQVNDGRQDLVLRAALAALHAWTVDGNEPPQSPLLEIVDGAIVRDEWGNALGGIRTPQVDAPISTLTGQGNPESIFCDIFGASTAFTPEQFAQRYESEDAYVAEVEASAGAAVEAGFLTQADAADLVAAAEEFTFPS